MKKLLEIRQKIVDIYYKIDAFLIPALKVIMAFIVLHTLNSRMGYNPKVGNVGFELIASLLCSFLPSGMVLLFAGVFSILHMYSLSLVVMIVGVIVYLIVYLLFLRFAPKASLVVALTPILMYWKLPFVLPIILGLCATPGTAVAIGCGVIVYYFLHVVITNASTLGNMGISEALATLQLVIDGFMANKGAIVFIAAFAVTIIVVYLIRRIPFKRNWEVAVGVGAVVQIIVILVGDMIIDTGVSVPSVLLGTILGAIIGILLKFFKFCIDFPHTEKVQFEDEEYYYYVKAVPKINLGKSAKRVKKISKYEDKYDDDDDDDDDDDYTDDYEDDYEDDYGVESESDKDNDGVLDLEDDDFFSKYNDEGEYIGEEADGEYSEDYYTEGGEYTSEGEYSGDLLDEDGNLLDPSMEIEYVEDGSAEEMEYSSSLKGRRK